MIARVAMIFVGFILWGVFLNVYYIALIMISTVVLGIESDLVDTILYWVCFVAGGLTATALMWRVWPRASLPAASAQPKSQEPTES